MPLRIPRRAALALPLAAAAPAPAAAQSWRPGQQARIIVPAAAGGTTDVMARLIAQHLQARWGTPFVVENRAGGGGTIGTLEMVRSRPDGTTLMHGNIGPQSIAYSLFRNLPYRPDDIACIAGTIAGPNVLVAGPAIQARTIPELVALLKANPGRISYGSTGVGQSPHLSGVWFTQLSGTQAIHVPYRGSAPAQTGLLAGDVALLFDNLTGVIELIRAGRARALAVTSRERSPQLPDVPALRETMPEFASYEVNTWFGLFGPAALPAEAVRTLNAEVNAWLDLPETRRRFAELGGMPLRMSPEEFLRFVRAEIEKWSAVIRREGLQLDVN
ncbi:Bug family tripartite tricarboxylate transporter substrate binding protein [Caldovatus aquaticus]|uniref:Tripartite tricarboxylate transporter substrate binding protein n=1 Tax=Caldovatus aquaticus TaxID=2865671 RepID=A0ABS7EYE5_9PROT|nr:tripartite tricarboxylate transporter substrate binding protein [Caldovatus aquaticus]MBW8268392.1 tripartite tricarboxylate transporter substrate binding protein [Caldovatus aquaticus]